MSLAEHQEEIDDGSIGFNFDALGYERWVPEPDADPTEKPSGLIDRTEILRGLYEGQQQRRVEYNDPTADLSISSTDQFFMDEYGRVVKIPQQQNQPQFQQHQEEIVNPVAISYGATMICKPENTYNQNTMLQNAMSNNYYTNGGYSNPYLDYMQQQQQQNIKSERECELNNWKMVSRFVNRSNGMTEEAIDKHIETQYSYENIYHESNQTDQFGYRRETNQQRFDRMANLHYNSQPPVYNIAQRDAEISAVERKKYHVESLVEFFDNLALYDWGIRIEEEKNKQRDVSKRYDSDAYRKLLMQSSDPNAPLNRIFGEGMENRGYTDELNRRLGGLFASVTVGEGENYRDEYEAKRRAFIESVKVR